jgi:hypothetical protein
MTRRSVDHLTDLRREAFKAVPHIDKQGTPWSRSQAHAEPFVAREIATEHFSSQRRLQQLGSVGAPQMFCAKRRQKIGWASLVFQAPDVVEPSLEREPVELAEWQSYKKGDAMLKP